MNKLGPISLSERRGPPLKYHQTQGDENMNDRLIGNEVDELFPRGMIHVMSEDNLATA